MHLLRLRRRCPLISLECSLLGSVGVPLLSHSTLERLLLVSEGVPLLNPCCCSSLDCFPFVSVAPDFIEFSSGNFVFVTAMSLFVQIAPPVIFTVELDFDFFFHFRGFVTVWPLFLSSSFLRIVLSYFSRDHLLFPR